MNKKFIPYLLSMAKVGCIGFGGGSILIPVIEDEVVTKAKIDTKEQYEKDVIVASITPGALPVEISASFGRRNFGIIGMVLYVLLMMSLFKDIIVCIKVKRQYAPAMSALGAIILVLSMISHIAIYYWFNVVVLSIAYFEGCYDRDSKNND